MKKFINTLENQQEQILNYFFERVTNGFVEGMNGAIRIIIRRAFGCNRSYPKQTSNISIKSINYKKVNMN